MRLAVVASHPVQYYAPLYRELARSLDLTVFYAHRDTAADQARAGFGQGFVWDVDLLSGYAHQFLHNVAPSPGLGRFAGVDTPGVGIALKHGSFDAVLVMGWYLKAFVQTLLAAKRLQLPVLVRGDSQLDTPRSLVKRLGKELLYPSFLRLFDAALVVGSKNAEYWVHYHYPPRRMFSSPHCVDTDWFAARATGSARNAVRERFGLDERIPVVLFAGKLLPFKRPLDAVLGSVHARAAGLPVELLVAGAGELEDAMRKTASEHQLPLHMMGFCNQTEMPHAYAAADVLVLPSNARETWGLVANEALACGKPVVLSSDAGCARDLAGDGLAGRVFEGGNVQDMADAIHATIKHPPQKTDIQKRSADHSLSAAAAGVISALQSVVQAKSCRNR